MARRAQNCQGIAFATYTGPVLKVVLARKHQVITREARLNNPRKSKDAVLQALCAEARNEYPGAKLKSYWTENG